MDKRKIRKIIGANIAGYRNAADLTQEQLSQSAKISQGYLSLIENGNRNIDAVDLYYISQLLKIPINLFYTEGNKKQVDHAVEILQLIEEAKGHGPGITKTLRDMLHLITRNKDEGKEDAAGTVLNLSRNALKDQPLKSKKKSA